MVRMTVLLVRANLLRWISNSMEEVASRPVGRGRGGGGREGWEEGGGRGGGRGEGGGGGLGGK